MPSSRVFEPLLRLAVPLLVVAAASAGGAAPEGAAERDASVLPGAPLSPPAARPAPGPPPSPSVPHLEFLSVTAGPMSPNGSRAWLVPGRLASSFVTDSPELLTVNARAQVRSHPELGDRIEWDVEPPRGFSLPVEPRLTGERLDIKLIREGGNPSGLGEPLQLSLTARLAGDETAQAATYSIQQDDRDRLRQEYVDLRRAHVPERAELLDKAQFVRRFGEKYPEFRFADLNFSVRPGREGQAPTGPRGAPPDTSGVRYSVIMAAEPLLATLQQTQRLYGRRLVISSGFRNPVHQVAVHASVEESHHQYGRAADLAVPSESTDPQSGAAIAAERDWLRLAAAAQRSATARPPARLRANALSGAQGLRRAADRPRRRRRVRAGREIAARAPKDPLSSELPGEPSIATQEDAAAPRTGRRRKGRISSLRTNRRRAGRSTNPALTQIVSAYGHPVWIEPMLACHVNTTGCHVHVDVRESGSTTVLTRVSGRVTDEAGRPVPGVSLLLAGMPASTNADGRFALKHVLSPRQYTLEVRYPGAKPASRFVEVRDGEVDVSLRVDTSGMPASARLPTTPEPPKAAGPGPVTAGVDPSVPAHPAPKPGGPAASDAVAGAAGLLAGGAAAAVGALARPRRTETGTPVQGKPAALPRPRLRLRRQVQPRAESSELPGAVPSDSSVP